MMTLALPRPVLTKGHFVQIDAYTDEALFEGIGVRIVFTTRDGGVSGGPYASLNLGDHVHDELSAVLENRRRVQEAFGASSAPLIVPKQVHGERIVGIDEADDVIASQREAVLGADAVEVGIPGVAALLCYADCVPVVIVSPTGRFAVVHAGWRGVDNLISVASVRWMAASDAAYTGEDPYKMLAHYNVYLGPHIHAECFETGPDVHARFVEQFGQECAYDATHIDLSAALRMQLVDVGIDPLRICDMNRCTVCNNTEFFSYRAQGGTAGRHGAFAYRSL